MAYIHKIRSYFTKETCFIPRCKARCCINPPLPQKWVIRHQDNIQRPIYSTTLIGKAKHFDNDVSYVYNTKPIQYIGKDQDGKDLYGIPKETVAQLNIKSLEDVKDLIKRFDGVENYCPFITEHAECSVYESRPTICREFGTLDDELDKCPEKSTINDIFKFYLKNFFDVKDTFSDIINMIRGKK